MGKYFKGWPNADSVSDEISKKLIEHGFVVDNNTGLFIHPKYGAFFGNTASKSIEEEYQRRDEAANFMVGINNNWPYYFLDYYEDGYEFIIGPSVKEIKDNYSADYGIYCTNYDKDLNKDKSTKRR